MTRATRNPPTVRTQSEAYELLLSTFWHSERMSDCYPLSPETSRGLAKSVGDFFDRTDSMVGYDISLLNREVFVMMALSRYNQELAVVLIQD